MADKRDYYEVLGVKKDATQDEIKSAFRKAAKQWHPDTHPGDKAAEAKFKEVNEANSVLSDPDKRAKYDAYGHAAFDPTMGGGQSSYGGGFGGGFGGFEDIFSMFTGGGFGGGSSARNANAPMRGRDLRTNITLTFEEAAFGVTKTINVVHQVNCEKCRGTGAKPGTAPEKCTRCNGTGHINVQQRTIMGVMNMTTTCDVCGGKGTIVKETCSDCRGTGRVRKTNAVNVKFPAGIDDDQMMNLSGQGDQGKNGGPAGDVQIVITVKPHKLFVRKGFDLYLDIAIPYSVAALGGEIEVPTLKGTEKFTIPSGTQSGTVFKLRDKGIQKLNSRAIGELYFKVTVDVPKKLNGKEKELLSKLADSLKEAPKPEKPKMTKGWQ